MKSAVRRILLLSALATPNALYALGLGEIHLNSALNQPFDADIEIVSATDDDLSALRASLAPSDTFARYGLDKPGYLADFSFKVIRSSGGKDFLKVTSPRPVTEPFVTMLVEADWPRGKLLREYTVLLDPPVYAPAPRSAEAPVATPRAQATARPSTPAPAPAPQPSADATAAPAAAPRATIAPGSTYRVRRNDTLWKIAEEAHPGSRSDVNRAMVAIYQSNPQAFEGNINLLRAGSTLSIPDASAVSAISASAAAAEVSRQYQSWRGGGTASGSDAGSGRLRLVTPEQGTSAASTATQAPAAPAPAPAAGGNAATQARVQQLEAELAEARRLLEVKNAELATLQGQTAAPGAPAGATGAAPAAGATGAAPAAGATGPAPAGEAAATPTEQTAAQPAEPSKEQKKPKKKAKPAAAPQEGPSLLEQLAGYWWVLLGLLAAGIAFVLYRRSRSESGDVDLQEALARTRTDLRARVAAPRDTTILVEERRPLDPSSAHAGGAATAPGRKATTAVPVDTISGEEPVSIESGDPLAEADFHMAYGLYDQAADLVQLAIKRAPQRRDLKVKLLEIYFVWGNRDRFLDLARELGATRGNAPAGEWDKILIMGKQIAPDDPLFASARTSPAALDMELHGSQGPLDMDLGADTSTAADMDVAGAKSTSDTGLDFEFTEPSTGDTTALAPSGETTALLPTVETPRIRPSHSDDPTQEVSIEELGIEVGDLKSLDDPTGAEDMLRGRSPAIVDDTVETPRVKGSVDDDEEDTLNATGILKEQTGILKGIDITGEVPEIDLGEPTGEVPALGTVRMARPPATGVDFDLGGDEPLTMSEVGTKLDLARAYVDMGDPEGARSILEEVLKEGSAEQKQEAERLIASLP
ncbi:MAG: FimV/HubP family polar landmark protein [Steroidobacteraceae bacterium]